MKAPVAVFAVGNRSRGDDSVAPLLLDRLRGWLEKEGLAEGFELVEEYQLQVEDALDLEGRRLALFIDAERDAPEAVAIREETARRGRAASHALEPAVVLEVCRQLTGTMPTAFVMGVRATHFDLGSGLSQEASEAMDEAWHLLHDLARHPYPAAWRAAAVQRKPRGERRCDESGWTTGGETHENTAIGREESPGKGRRHESQAGNAGNRRQERASGEKAQGPGDRATDSG